VAGDSAGPPCAAVLKAAVPISITMTEAHRIRQLEAQLKAALQQQADAEADAQEADRDARGFELRMETALAEVARLRQEKQCPEPVAPARRGKSGGAGGEPSVGLKLQLQECRQELAAAQVEIKRLGKQLKLAEARCDAGELARMAPWSPPGTVSRPGWLPANWPIAAGALGLFPPPGLTRRRPVCFRRQYSATHACSGGQNIRGQPSNRVCRS